MQISLDCDVGRVRGRARRAPQAPSASATPRGLVMPREGRARPSWAANALSTRPRSRWLALARRRDRRCRAPVGSQDLLGSARGARRVRRRTSALVAQHHVAALVGLVPSVRGPARGWRRPSSSIARRGAAAIVVILAATSESTILSFVPLGRRFRPRPCSTDRSVRARARSCLLTREESIGSVMWC